MVIYICTNFHENILDGIKILERTQFSYEKIQKDIIPYKMLVELRFFYSAYRLMVIYICTTFHKNILNGI